MFRDLQSLKKSSPSNSMKNMNPQLKNESKINSNSSQDVIKSNLQLEPLVRSLVSLVMDVPMAKFRLDYNLSISEVTGSVTGG